ncbi:flagellar basal-body rod protein FlgF [Maridesulfovibrio hydrothermalis]|uniref:Flagellar basal-body rod protein FlgF n=1 Tax=Maridesulfovibrio hydrothermalis AM13 = DSM 14728 TaxID=1121451 RepID=L0RCP5_9BACT|nr:flagellar basal-body rod protein FlgF [Maridesulfovibrio hydrothermalis]CCO23982.1 Flagellar basal-body rod protein FlgF [Maridesulfovibrio hydrothermalis AM13 = DSM 14728]
MRASIFSALFGAMSNEHRIDISANNLANVNTTGFKRDNCAFQDTFIRFAHDYVVDAKPFIRDKDMFPAPKIMARPRLSEEVIDLSQGAFQRTGNPLDLAIRGNGFFKVQKDGGEFLTRNGVFSLSPDGVLVTEQGYPVVANGGQVTVPPRSNVVIDAEGVITADGEEIAKLDFVQPADAKQLKKEGENLYTLEGEEVPGEGEIVQGYIEKSNVEVVNEMVAMIECQRSFEMYQKMIKTTDQLDLKVIQQVGRVT